MSVSKTIVTSDKYNTTFNSPTIKLLCNTCFPQLGFIFRIIFNSLCLPLKKRGNIVLQLSVCRYVDQAKSVLYLFYMYPLLESCQTVQWIPLGS